MPNLTILLPAYNEEATIGKLIDEIRSLPIKCDILVADSEGTDKTAKISISKGVKVLQCKRGKGNAVREAIKHIKSKYVLMMDSDGTYPVGEIPKLMMCLASGDVVKGYRKHCENGAMSWQSNIGNKGLSFVVSVLFGKWVADVDSGMWLFRTEILKQFNLTSPKFTLEMDLFTNVVKSKCRFVEIPIGYLPRPDGSKAKIKWTDWAEIGWFMLKRRFTLDVNLAILAVILFADGLGSIIVQPSDGLWLFIGRIVRMAIGVILMVFAWQIDRKEKLSNARSVDSRR